MSLAANSRWNLLAFTFTLAAHFITVPFVISHIGLTEFGHAGLVVAVWAPLVLVGTVLGQAATQQMADRISQGDSEASRKFAQSAIFLCLIACTATAILVATIGRPLLGWLVDQPREAHKWYTEIAVAGIGWAAQQYALVLQGICTAHQNYRTIAKVGAASAVATVAATLSFSTWWPNALGYLAGISVGLILSAGAWWIAIRVSLGREVLWPMAHAAETRGLLRFGKWQTFTQLAGTLGNQIDRYVLGSLASPTVIGQYNAANRLQEAAYAGIVKVAEVLFPYFGANSRREPAAQAHFYLIAAWVVMTFSSAVLAPMIPLADPLLRLWAGPEVANGGALLLQTLVFGGLVGCGSNVATYYFMGTGQVSLLALISVVYSVLTIILSVVLLRLVGPYAAGVGLAIASVVRVALSLALLKRAFGAILTARDLFISNVLPLIAGTALAWTMAKVAPDFGMHNWLSVIGAYVLLSLAVLLAVTGCTATTSFGRELLVSLARGRQAEASA